ncbi:MAG: hypothetical protein MZU84_06410 [Sphingobacterium sp.]|nr:hypothetical protein [Sphingobacterium sp.]
MSGVDLPVRAAAEPGPARTSPPSASRPRTCRRSVASALPTLRPDGFVAATSTGNLYVAGGGGQGVVYGVVHLLEKYFGCRRFSPTAEVFPPRDDLALGCLFEAENPVNDVRVVNGEFALDADYRDWMRLHDHPRPLRRRLLRPHLPAARPLADLFRRPSRVFRPDERQADHRPALPLAARGLRHRRGQAPRGDGRPAGQDRSGRSARTTTSPTASAPSA